MQMMAASYKRYIPVQKWKGIEKLQTIVGLLVIVVANPPPKGISSRAIDEHGACHQTGSHAAT